MNREVKDRFLIDSVTIHPSLITPHSNFHRPSAALVGAREARGEGDGGDHAGMLGDAAARDVEGRAVIDRGADEGQAERDVDGLAEREALDGDHRLVMVARNHGVELAARGAQKDRVGRVRPRHVQARPLLTRLDRRA